jgi:hypothetical protein
MEIERHAMVDQPQLVAAFQDVDVAQRAVGVYDVRIEPNDRRCQMRVDRRRQGGVEGESLG